VSDADKFNCNNAVTSPDVTLVTTWAKAAGLDVPIVNAPMGGAAGGRLARRYRAPAASA
jgi:hypothetical protein